MEQDNEYIINTPDIKIKTDLVAKLIIIAFIISIAWITIFGRYGNEEIGSYFEKKNYTTQYWVYLQPDNANVKNYRVKGDIERQTDDGYFYYLWRVYWDNGGYTDFDDCDITEATKKNNYVNCISINDNSYEIRLGEKVK